MANSRGKKAVFNWSGGKDSALALWKVLQKGDYDVVALLTTVNKESRRSSMHAIPLSLLEKQAESIGIPLFMAGLEPHGDMQDYESAMRKVVEHFVGQGVEYFIFGDIFLHDVKSYREKQLRPYGVTVVEPLWGKTSEAIMDEFLASGLRTVVVTTMADVLGKEFIGREIDSGFPAALPSGTDVCGENGEYHTFCYGGGMFRYPVEYVLGEPIQVSYPVRLEDGAEKVYSYWYADLRDTGMNHREMLNTKITKNGKKPEQEKT